MTTAADEAIAVADNADEKRYEITLDGEFAGFVEYHRRPGQIAFIHTEIDDRFEGKGLGSKLVAHVLDEARAAGDAVLPFCPFVRSWIERHPDYLALVPESRREGFGL